MRHALPLIVGTVAHPPKLPIDSLSCQDQLHFLSNEAQKNYESCILAFDKIPVEEAFDHQLSRWYELRQTLRQLVDTKNHTRQINLTEIGEILKSYRNLSHYQGQWEQRQVLARRLCQESGWEIITQGIPHAKKIQAIKAKWPTHGALAHLNESGIVRLQEEAIPQLTQWIARCQREFNRKKKTLPETDIKQLANWLSQTQLWLSQYQQGLWHAMLARLILACTPSTSGTNDVLYELLTTCQQLGANHPNLPLLQQKLTPTREFITQSLSRMTYHLLRSPLAVEARHQLFWLSPSPQWRLDEFACDWRLVPRTLGIFTLTLKQAAKSWRRFFMPSACLFSDWIRSLRHLFIEQRLLSSLADQPVKKWGHTANDCTTLLKRIAAHQQALTTAYRHIIIPSAWHPFQRTQRKRQSQAKAYLQTQLHQIEQMRLKLACYMTDQLNEIDVNHHDVFADAILDTDILQQIQTALKQTAQWDKKNQSSQVNKYLQKQIKRINDWTSQRQEQLATRRVNAILTHLIQGNTLNNNELNWLANYSPQSPDIMYLLAKQGIRQLFEQCKQAFLELAARLETSLETSDEKSESPDDNPQALMQLQTMSLCLRNSCEQLKQRRILECWDYFINTQLRQVSCDILTPPQEAKGHTFCAARLTLVMHTGHLKQQQQTKKILQDLHNDLPALKQRLVMDIQRQDQDTLYRYRMQAIERLLSRCQNALHDHGFSTAEQVVFAKCANQVLTQEEIGLTTLMNKNRYQRTRFGQRVQGIRWQYQDGLATKLLRLIAEVANQLDERQLAHLTQKERGFLCAAETFRTLTHHAQRIFPKFHLFAPSMPVQEAATQEPSPTIRSTL
jgi:hypothetical protein